MGKCQGFKPKSPLFLSKFLKFRRFRQLIRLISELLDPLEALLYQSAALRQILGFRLCLGYTLVRLLYQCVKLGELRPEISQQL